MHALLRNQMPLAQAGPASILVVEDNIILRFALSAWLRDAGYNVIEASSADEAVRLLNSLLLVDCVISDVEMPGMLNGYDLARHIRREFPELPVIMVSGNMELPTDEGINVFDFFRKPYSFDEIVRRVTALIPHKHKRTADEC